MRATGFALVFAACAALAPLGCNRKGAAPPPPKAEVLVSVPVHMSIVDSEEFTGRTEATIAVEVRPRATGDIVKVNFQDGAMVKKGETLFEIEPKQYKAELDRAEATLNQTEVRFKRLDADYQRAAVLYASKSIAQEEFDRVKGDRMEAEASVGVAKANVVLAKQNYDYTKVTALVSGRTSRRFKDEGNLAEKDVTVLTTIVALDPMYVYFDVDERTVLKLRTLLKKGKIKAVEGMDFEFGLAEEPGFPHKGRIDFEDNKIDSGTGTRMLRGLFKNSKHIDPGLFVRVRLLVGEKYDALLISERAIATDQGQKFIYVINGDKKAEYRELKREDIGQLENGLRVIWRGVNDGEQIVVSGLQRVRPNAVVEPKLVPMPGFPAAK